MEEYREMHRHMHGYLPVDRLLFVIRGPTPTEGSIPMAKRDGAVGSEIDRASLPPAPPPIARSPLDFAPKARRDGPAAVQADYERAPDARGGASRAGHSTADLLRDPVGVLNDIADRSTGHAELERELAALTGTIGRSADRRPAASHDGTAVAGQAAGDGEPSTMVARPDAENAYVAEADAIPGAMGRGNGASGPDDRGPGEMDPTHSIPDSTAAKLAQLGKLVAEWASQDREDDEAFAKYLAGRFERKRAREEALGKAIAELADLLAWEHREHATETTELKRSISQLLAEMAGIARTAVMAAKEADSTGGRLTLSSP